LNVTQTDIARRVGMDVSSVNKILNQRPHAVFSKQKVREVLRVARELGYDLGSVKHAHHRSYVRKDVMVAVEVAIYGARGGLHDRGTAVARNVSLGGAHLIAISLPRCTIPLRPSAVGLRRLGGAVPMPEILGRIVRFTHAGESVGLAIEFLEGQEDRAAEFYKSLRPARPSVTGRRKNDALVLRQPAGFPLYAPQGPSADR
jgi:hypothetical protein